MLSIALKDMPPRKHWKGKLPMSFRTRRRPKPVEPIRVVVPRPEHDPMLAEFERDASIAAAKIKRLTEQLGREQKKAAKIDRRIAERKKSLGIKQT